MIHPRVLAILSVLAGTAVGAFVINLLMDVIPWQPPAGVTIETVSPYNQWVQSLPLQAFQMLLGIFLTGALAGGAVSHLITKKTKYRFSLVTGFLLIIFTIGRFLNFTHPEWFTYAACIGIMLFAWLGGRIVAK